MHLNRKTAEHQVESRFRWLTSKKAVTARPGARFGPGGPAGIRQGSRRMSASFGWSMYTGEAFSPHKLPELTTLTGENSYTSWAEILDCGDVSLTFLDNTVALKQLDKAHKVSYSVEPYSQCLIERKSAL